MRQASLHLARCGVLMLLIVCSLSPSCFAADCSEVSCECCRSRPDSYEPARRLLVLCQAFVTVLSLAAALLVRRNSNGVSLPEHVIGFSQVIARARDAHDLQILRIDNGPKSIARLVMRRPELGEIGPENALLRRIK